MEGFSPSSVPVSGKHRAESATLQLNLWPWGPSCLLQQGMFPQGLPSMAGEALPCASTSGRAFGLPAVPLRVRQDSWHPAYCWGLCWHQLQPAAKPRPGPAESAEPPT